MTGEKIILTLTNAFSGAHAAHESRPWPRRVVDGDLWRDLGCQLGDGLLTLAGLWGDAGVVHMALLDATRGELAIASLPCEGGKFPSVGAYHTPAIRLERAIQDLFGYEPVGAQIHGLGWTMDDGRSARLLAPERYRLLPARATISCPPREKGCIRSPSAQCMPA